MASHELPPAYTGMEEANRRIAEVAKARASVLDLGGLGLTRVPEALHAEPAHYDLRCVEHLYLGAPEALYEVPYWDRGDEARSICNSLTSLPPSLFSSLPQLKSLRLDRNRIETLSPEIVGLETLALLDLSGNRIGDDGIRTLIGLKALTSLHLSDNNVGAGGARAIASINALTSLDLSGNNIGSNGAKALASLKALTWLDLSENHIGPTGAKAIGGLSALTWLHLSGNHIGREGVRALAALKSLTSLHLSFNNIGDDGARALAGLQALTWLHLSYNGIGAEGARALAGLTALTCLHVAGNNIGAEGVRALAGLTALTCLHVAGNNIGAEGARALAGLRGLSWLDLSGFHLMMYGERIGASSAGARAYRKSGDGLYCSDSGIGDEGAKALAGLEALTWLDLSCNGIGDEGAKALAGLKGLTSLGLFGNHISAEGLNALAGLKALTSLDLSHNAVGDHGAKALSNLKALTWLGLSYNSIGAEGAEALAGLKALNWLDLSDNAVGDQGARALSKLKALTWLDLSNNSIGTLGARALAGLKALAWLDLSANRIGAERAADMSMLMSLRKLRHLDLSECNLGEPLPPIWTLPLLSTLYLHDVTLAGVPPEVLSADSEECCLEALRAHFADLQSGHSEVTDIKLMILGNGRVGKTQICRMLRGEAYDAAIKSTHGIEVSAATLPLGEGNSATLRIWDFGGQDIYHGTHALFLRSRAIFPVVWTPASEAMEFHDYDGFTFRNQPLGYWLAYIRECAGPNSPALVIQSQCDEPEHEALRPPVPDEALTSLPFRKLLQYSAKTDRGRAALNETLADAVRWLRRKRGVEKIGAGRARVKAELETMREAGTQLLPMNDYISLCESDGSISSSELLLDYLHNSGAVFYRQGLFGDAIILDQAWALAAVYAALDRESKAVKFIEAERGRFRRSDLAALVWKDKSEDEQELFLSFMCQCGICFVIRNGDDERGIESIYVAPDLLPQRGDAEVERVLKERWHIGEAAAGETLTYELLPPGLMRTLIARIGGSAGLAGEYWRDGFYVYDEDTNSRALVEQHRTVGWAGAIEIHTQGGKAEELLAIVLRFIDDRHALVGTGPAQRVRKQREASAAELKAPAIKPGYEPSEAAEWAVSYSWGDDLSEEGREREAVVDRFCAEAEGRGITIVRDKTAMRHGDRISKFMDRIARSDRVFIFLSDKYLKSAFCMHELFEVWRNCSQEDAAFIERTRIYLLPCAQIGEFEDRLGYTTYWQDRFDKMSKAVKKHGPAVLGAADLADYRRMQDFAGKTPDMLRLVLDVLRPNSFEDFLNYSFE